MLTSAITIPKLKPLIVISVSPDHLPTIGDIEVTNGVSTHLYVILAVVWVLPIPSDMVPVLTTSRMSSVGATVPFG